jgi:hypothetical protein
MTSHLATVHASRDVPDSTDIFLHQHQQNPPL